MLRRIRFVLAALGLGLAAVPGTLVAQAAQPAPVDCDSFADGQQTAPIVVVTQPLPRVTLSAGPLTIQGAALDCHADAGTGISRVSVFLGRREAGGVPLGDAVLRGQSPVRVLPADQYGLSGWTLSAPVPLQPGQVNELYVYAQSAVTNMETAVAVQVLGASAAGEGATTPPPTAVPAVVLGAGEGVPAETPASTPEMTPDPGEGPPVAPADEAPAE